MAILDVVKLDVLSDNYIVQKFESEKQWELTLGSRLVVNEGQEAFFVKGGICLDLFAPGTHTLVSKNIPLLDKIINLPFGGVTPFTTEVWFVNKTVKRDLPWGTPQRISVIEPKLGFPINVGACGTWGFRVENSRCFVNQIVGAQLGADSQKIYSYFIGEIREKLGQTVSSVLNNGTSFFKINSQRTEIADAVKKAIADEFGKFGMEVVNFNITNINIPTHEMSQIQNVMAKKMEMQQLGDVKVNQGYITAKSLDIMREAAKNQGGAGAIMGAVTGTGLGIGAGFPIARAVSKAISSAAGAEQMQNEKNNSPGIRLKTLKELYDNGLLSQEEYNAKKSEIIKLI